MADPQHPVPFSSSHRASDLPEEVDSAASHQSFLHNWRVRLLGAVLLLGLVSFAIWYFSSSSGPREQDRVRHPAGYSIVVPPGWTPKISTKAEGDNVRDSITLEPDKWIGLAPSIWVRRESGPPDVTKLKSEGFTEGPFHGVSAWRQQKKPGKYQIRRVYVQLGDDWYELGCSLPGLEATRMDDWWQYVESFRPIATTATASATSTSTSPP